MWHAWGKINAEEVLDEKKTQDLGMDGGTLLN
jgi:hypothetical protein